MEPHTIPSAAAISRCVPVTAPDDATLLVVTVIFILSGSAFPILSMPTVLQRLGMIRFRKSLD